MEFIGDRAEFRSLIMRGAWLELVTFGFYRFWLATDIRRYLWSSTEIDGDAAEYTGRGKELLIGFLVALAIMVPIYLGYFLLGIESERWKSFASTPLVILFYAFGQFAIYRARRYRLTRTVWRGVRFWMDGSGWAYALRAMGWGLLVVITLGLALPWRDEWLERYKMQHSWYGELQGDFEAEGWDFFKKAWFLWVLAPISMIILPLAPLVYAEFKARQWRWWLGGLRIGGVRLESTLAHTAFYKLYWKVVGWWVLLSVLFALYCFGVASIIIQAGGASGGADALLRSGPFVALLLPGYLGMILAMNVIMRMYLQRDLWAKIVGSIEVHDIAAAANVRAKGELAGALGEGFADGLDVAGF
jgi:uncharacterized membrane protein YjgN (DUF898 family)